MRPSLIATVLLALAPFGFAQSGTEKADAKKADATAESKESESDAKWDTNTVHGPAKKIELSLEEGTWMNLDVSPDGKTIVFDLLGDIFAMKLKGGEATALITGHAYTVQPRFSPDGKSIAFTSDAGGGDNLWVMDADGANPRAVTKEKFRLLNNPSWTPDGKYLHRPQALHREPFARRR